jgi:D-alanyl-D-alanine carboxypeptidase
MTTGGRGVDDRRRQPQRPHPLLVALVLSLAALMAPDAVLAPSPIPAAAGEPAAFLVPPDPPAPRLALRVDPLDVVSGLSARPARVVPRVVRAAEYQNALDAALAASEAPGLSFAIVRNGWVAWAGASGENPGQGRAMSPDDPMVIASITKTFVATLILDLVEEGRLRLSDRVEALLPETAELTRSVTLRQLLDHTSGLADLFNDTTRLALEQAPGRAWTTQQVLGALGEPWLKPGEGWDYSNTNYLLLALIAERVTGQRLADALETRYLGPLHLDASRLLSGDDPGPLSAAWSTIFYGSGAMVSSAPDLARWGDALYDGELLEPATERAMITFNSDDYGLGVQRLRFGRERGYGHTGLLRGHTSVLLHLPRSDVTLALIANSNRVDLDVVLTARPSRGRSLIELAAGRAADGSAPSIGSAP